MAKILRFELPADGEWHTVGMSSNVLGAGSRRSHHVEFWFLDDPAHNTDRQFAVFATGDELPPDAKHLHVVLDAGGYFVWHLITRRA